jgi:hypothetical protein
MSSHTKQQLIEIARDRGVTYSHLTKAQLADRLGVTVTITVTPTQRKKAYNREYYLKNRDRAAAYNREYYLKNQDTISQKARAYYQKNSSSISQKTQEYHLTNPAKKHQWPVTYSTKQERRAAILRAHGVPYRLPGSPYPGDRILWDRSIVRLARELAKAVAAFQTRSPTLTKAVAPGPADDGGLSQLRIPTGIRTSDQLS